MGAGGVGISEFLPEECVHDIRYQRNGGCFVSTKRAIIFFVIGILVAIAMFVLMYYFGPSRQLDKIQTDIKDIDELINETINEENVENIRLPGHFRPIQYRLKMHPVLDEYDPENFTYTGEVRILVECMVKTNKIVLNVDSLTIHETNVSVTTRQLVGSTATLDLWHDDGDVIQKNGSNNFVRTVDNSTVSRMDQSDELNDAEPMQYESVHLMIQEVYQEPENQKLIITMQYLLQEEHNYTVAILFRGNISSNLVGFYRTSYRDSSNHKRWLATTNFHPIFARRVFPCFDEPNFKSTFEISIARRTNMTALSNMPLKDTEPFSDGNNWVWDHFERSLPMPTHLISFTICDFKNLRNTTNMAGPSINIWAPENDLSRASFALNSAHLILEFLEKYLDQVYPLTKIDLLAFPNFAKGTMGSWGILSFRKSSLLLEPMSNSWQRKQHIFMSLTHALSHQWFGNLVTMKWWSDLWLNEGIGSFMAEVLQRELKPNWQSSNDFPYRIMYKSFNADSLKSTQSIYAEYKHLSQIEQIYDTIVPSKGTSLVRMLNYSITEDVFQTGLRRYLRAQSYQSSDQETLWDILTAVAVNASTLPVDITVKQLMDSWTHQKGYPYITVKRNYQSGESLIQQNIFIQNNVSEDTLWYIPITYTTTDDVINVVWMKAERNITVTLPTSGWVLCNINQAGYFRVNYDDANWDLLIEQLHKDPGDLPVASRGQLLDDAFELAQLGIINYSIPLKLTQYLRNNEPNYVPWLSALNSLDELGILFDNYEYTDVFAQFVLNLVQPRLDMLGMHEKSNEPQNDRILRWRLLKITCKLLYEPCIEWARQEFDKWRQKTDPDRLNSLQFEYRRVVQCAVIRTGNRQEWDFLWNRTRNPIISPADLRNIYLSLGCTHDPLLIYRYLQLTLQGNISVEYVPYVWQSISHPAGIRSGLHFLRLNWKLIFAVYKDVNLVLSSICQDFLSFLSTDIDLDDLTEFFKMNTDDLRSVANLMQSTVDSIKLRIEWVHENLMSLVTWLRKENEKNENIFRYY